MRGVEKGVQFVQLIERLLWSAIPFSTDQCTIWLVVCGLLLLAAEAAVSSIRNKVLGRRVPYRLKYCATNRKVTDLNICADNVKNM